MYSGALLYMYQLTHERRDRVAQLKTGQLSLQGVKGAWMVVLEKRSKPVRIAGHLH